MTEEGGGWFCRHGRVAAGPQPGARVDRLVVAALREAGVPIEGAYPKPVTDDVVRTADYVVTIGAVNVALLNPGKSHLKWDIHDPGDASFEQGRALVTELGARVRGLWAGIRDEPHPRSGLGQGLPVLGGASRPGPGRWGG